MWFIVGFFLLLANQTNASEQLCVEDNVLKCQELGYTEKSCIYGGVACPYDASLWYCSTWSCEDGRYFTQENQPDKYTCTEIIYKGITCYDCLSGCPNGEVDYNYCWNKMLNTIVKNKSYCERTGYIHNISDCINYLVCASDLSKVRCLY